MTRKSLVAVVVAVVLVLAAVGGYLWETGRTLDRVTVSTAPPECTGAVVRPSGLLLARRGMDCRIEVEVVNDSTRTVHVGAASFAYLGPQGGAVLRAGELEGYPSTGSDLDQRVTIDATIEPGESLGFRLPVRFRDRGCNEGGTTTFGDLVRVDVGWLGRERVAVAPEELRFRQRGPAAGCDRM